MRVPNPETCGVQGLSHGGGYGRVKPPVNNFFCASHKTYIFFFKSGQIYMEDAEFSEGGIFRGENFPRGEYSEGEGEVFREGSFPRTDASI